MNSPDILKFVILALLIVFAFGLLISGAVMIVNTFNNIKAKFLTYEDRFKAIETNVKNLIETTKSKL